MECKECHTLGHLCDRCFLNMWKDRVDEALKTIQPEGFWHDIDRLIAMVRERDAARFAYASEFDGDVGSIHQNIRLMKARISQLESALREAQSFLATDKLDDARAARETVARVLAPGKKND